MSIVFLAAFIILMLFAVVIFRGAPYVPTLRQQVRDALDLLDLQPGQTLFELGSGDGRLLRAAAERGIYAVGYELNPLLVLWTRLRHWKYRRYITVKWADCWQVEWPDSDGMYVFLLERFMGKLDKKIVHYTKGRPYKVVSFAFEIPNRKPEKAKKGLRLYRYP